MVLYAFKAPDFAPNFFKNDAKYRVFWTKTKYLIFQKTKIKNPSKALFQAIKGFKRLAFTYEIDARSFSEISTSLMWNNLLRKLWNRKLRFLWNKINPLSHAAGVFHIAKQYFIPEGHFTNPERIYFVEKSTSEEVLFSGGSSGIRTRDRPVMSRMLWPTELRIHFY